MRTDAVGRGVTDRPRPPMCAQGALGAGILGKALPSRKRRIKLTNMENEFNTHVSRGEQRRIPHLHPSPGLLASITPQGRAWIWTKERLPGARTGFSLSFVLPARAPGALQTLRRVGTRARRQWPGVGGDSERKQGGGDSR